MMEAVRGTERLQRLGSNSDYALGSSVVPTPTIRGIWGRDSRQAPNWSTEVHGNGYVQGVFRLGERPSEVVLHEGYFSLFAGFVGLVSDSLVAAEIGDAPVRIPIDPVQ